MVVVAKTGTNNLFRQVWGRSCQWLAQKQGKIQGSKKAGFQADKKKESKEHSPDQCTNTYRVQINFMRGWHPVDVQRKNHCQEQHGK
mmetsp:Transcript_24819/g.29259  ORF Transcript_24819/g.29259 Transcript_24819/m.29259 type:complete len:87 (-) Transcript_24819:18-278(-)